MKAPLVWLFTAHHGNGKTPLLPVASFFIGGITEGEAALEKLTPSSEDYLEAIVAIGGSLTHPVRNVDIASELDVTKASVSKAIHVLREEGMVHQEPYGGVRLTPDGLARGVAVLCRHKVMYAFLTQKLGIDERTADREACGIEHAISDASFQHWLAYAERLGLDIEGLPRISMGYNRI